MSDRIGILQEGRLVQVGTAREIYERPRSRFVADFIGTSNFIEGTLSDPPEAGTATIEAPGGLRVRAKLPDWGEPAGAVTLAVRPEKIRMLRDGEALANRFTARVAAQP